VIKLKIFYLTTLAFIICLLSPAAKAERANPQEGVENIEGADSDEIPPTNPQLIRQDGVTVFDNNNPNNSGSNSHQNNHLSENINEVPRDNGPDGDSQQ